MTFERYTRGGRVIACTTFPFCEVQTAPGESCVGCSHWVRIRLRGITEWILSESCPCLECMSMYFLQEDPPQGEARRFPCWTNQPLAWFREDEADILPPHFHRPPESGFRPLQTG